MPDDRVVYSPSPGPTLCGRPSGKPARRRGIRSGVLTTCAIGESRCSICAGCHGRIGEWVGQRNLAVTANTYTHVLLDERELDYGALLVA
jgi:hypothetical protein